MSGLRDKLQRLKGTRSTNADTAELHQDADVKGKRILGVSDSQQGEGKPLGSGWETIGVEIRGNDFGTYIRRSVAYPLQHRHGRCNLRELTETASRLSALSADKVNRYKDLLFLDTETTGLGVGTGNVPFMIGVGYYTESHFMVEQNFIRNPSEELAMLCDLRDKLDNYTHIVTYNGRTFDWPVLCNRFVMHRLPLSAKPAHIDCLYPSRSLWRTTLASCRLSSVEQNRLGFTRVQDVPGSLAPALYFQYLSEGNPLVLTGVFQHNELDIVSLAGLAVYFAGLLGGDPGYAGNSSEELFRLGLWYGKLGRPDLAGRCMEDLVECAWYTEHGLLPELASWYKKSGQFELAASLWRRYIETKGEKLMEIRPFIELAIFSEHKSKDYAEALRYAEEALRRARRRMSLMRLADAAGCEDIERRIARLKKKTKQTAAKVSSVGLLL
jgi:hypothetical protein